MFVRLSKFVGKISIFLAAMLIVLVGFFGFLHQALAVGLTVGTDALQLGSSDNLFSGTISTTGPAGNFLLLRQGANDMFSINNAGNFWSNGILTFASNTLNTIDVAGGQIVGLDYTPATSTAAVPLLYLQNNYAPLSGGSGNIGSAFVQGGNSFATTTILGTNDNYHLIFETNSAARMTIYNNGNIGIGTTVPGSKLDLNGTISTAKIFTIDSSAVADRAQLGFGIYQNYSLIQSYGLGTSAGSLAINPLGNNVGIGLTNPSAKLSVNGGIKASRLGYFGTYDATLVQGIWSIAENYAINTVTNTFGSQYGIVYAHTNASSTGLTNGPIAGWGHQILFVNNGIYKAGVSMDNGNAYFNGSVGIGTTIPGFKLGVAGSIHLRGLNAVLEMGNGNTASTYGSVGFNNSTNDVELKQKYNSGGIRFFTNTSSERLSIISNGNVGIASTSPSLKLGIGGTGRLIDLGGAGTVAGLTTPVFNDEAVSLGYLKNNYSATSSSLWGGTKNGNIWNGDSGAGNVGIGTTAPGAKLEVAGTFRLGELYYSDLKSLALPIGTETWVNLATIPNNSTVRFQIRTGSSNSEEMAEVKVFGTYHIAQTGITVERQTYNAHLREVRVTGSDGGAKTVYVRVRTDASAPTLTWRIIESKGTPTINNVEAAPTGGLALLVNGNLSINTNVDMNIAGNVGIGTTNPTAKLDVRSGNINFSGNLNFIDGSTSVDREISFNNGNVYFRLGFNRGYESYWSNNAYYNGTQWNYVNTSGYSGQATKVTNSYGAFRFLTASNAANPVVWNERFTVLNNGNVGIASTTPVAKLGLAGSGRVIDIGGGRIGGMDITPLARDEAVSLGYILDNYRATSTTDNLWSLTGNALINDTSFLGSTNNYDVLFKTNNTERMRILKGGNIGIGTTTPRTALDTGTGVLSGAANDYIKAQFTITGGGTITWSSNKLKWTNRFIAIPVAQTSAGSGYIDITQPVVAIPAGQVYDGVARAADATGVSLNIWEALYAVHTVGGSNGAITYQIVRYTNAFNAPSNWILVAAVNGEDGSVRLANGYVLKSGGSYSGGVDSQYVQAQGVTPGVQQAAHINISGSGLFGGNVGIGTTTPSVKLDVVGSIAAAGRPNTAYNINAGSFGGNTYYAYNSLCAGESTGYCNGTGGTVIGIANTNAKNNIPTSGVTFFNNGGNVSVGTTTATTKLYISGGAGDVININGGQVAGLNSTQVNNDQAVSLGYLKANYNASTTSFWSGSLTGNIYNANSGNIGIGTTTPAEKLQIKSGSILLDNNYGIKLKNAAGTSSAYISMPPGDALTLDAVDGGMISLKTGSGFHATRLLLDASGNIAFNTNQLYLNAAGNIGVGTTTPETKLHVSGIIKSGQVGTSGGIYLARSSDGTSQVSLVSSSTNEFIINQSGGLNSKFIMGASGIEFQTENSTSPYDKITRMIIKHGDSGNVGIGTVVPTQKLVVSSIDTAPLLNAATATNSALMLSNSDTGYGTFFGTLGSGTGLIQQRRQASAVYYDLALNPYGGNVGIASSTPAAKLAIGNTGRLIHLGGGGTVAGLTDPTNDDEAVSRGYLNNNYKSLWGGTKNDNIWNGDAGVGNVGIGTTVPLAKLHVNGGMVLNRTAVTSTTYTASTTDYIIAFTSLTANATLTLPSALCDSGRVFLIVNETNTAYKVIITPQSGTIIGNSSLSLNAYNSTPVYCNGNKTTPAWFIY